MLQIINPSPQKDRNPSLECSQQEKQVVQNERPPEGCWQNISRPISQGASFSVLYWGGGEVGWDLDQRSRTPRICSNCNSVVDTWRGRFDNAQVTLRMCAAEGGGFKRYVHDFLMLSAKATMQFHLPTFYQWSVSQKKKVLTERVVLGTLMDIHNRRMPAQGCGINVENLPCRWVDSLRAHARQLRFEAHAGQGAFAALVLDANGKELRVAEMLQRRGKARIDRLLIVLGGPDGIIKGHADALRCVIEEFTDFPLLRCSLPGGIMHSYYALAALFTLHDQGVLLPFLSHLASLLPPIDRTVQRHHVPDTSMPNNNDNKLGLPVVHSAMLSAAALQSMPLAMQCLVGKPVPKGSVAMTMGSQPLQQKDIQHNLAHLVPRQPEHALPTAKWPVQAKPLFCPPLPPSQLTSSAPEDHVLRDALLALQLLSDKGKAPGIAIGTPAGTVGENEGNSHNSHVEAQALAQMQVQSSVTTVPLVPHPPAFPPPEQLLIK